MKYRSMTAALVFITLTAPLYAEKGDRSLQAPKEVRAVRLHDHITVDGIPDEAAWNSAPPVTAFIQSTPAEGAPPTERTVVRLLYDDNALYVGARMYDNAPDSVDANLGRRDVSTTTDLFGIFLDTYHDRRSGFYFGVSAAGTLYDGTLTNDDWSDDSWDGVWEGRAHRDSLGWTAELRIPYSQLRFQEGKEIVWGVNFRRDIGRRNETDQLVYTPKDGTGYVSRFVDLVGIENIDPPQRFTILPYVTTRAEYTHAAPGDPFNRGRRYTPATGGDVKYGIGTNLTLDATVNPDFGQVEVDPAVVNLSDVETFFQEKRPFFVEGANIFDFGEGGVTNNWSFNWSDPQFFYSRRIGRAPQGALPSSDYADVPIGTRIIGAAKLSGKLADNLSIGTLHAVTDREVARIESGGAESSVAVEPLTYYGVARLQKEYAEGREGLGVLATLTERRLDDPALRNELAGRSMAGGVDGWLSLDSSRSWILAGWLGASRVEGTAAEMTSLQEDSRHYYQRPDARSYRVDSAATSLMGTSGRIKLVKQKGNFMINSALGFVSPGFELDDLGFLWHGDIINGHFGAAYRWVEPTSWYQSLFVLGALFGSLDFDGNDVWKGVYYRTEWQLPNLSFIQFDAAYNPESINNRRTRGGPLTLNHRGYQIDFMAQTNDKERVVLSVGENAYWTSVDRSWSLLATLTLKPASNVLVSVGPEFDRGSEYAQYVGTFDDPTAAATYGRRYVLATIDQTALSANIRVNWTFTPELSLQLYVQPLISSGDYHDYKEVSRPRTYDYRQYTPDEVSFADNTYTVDPDGGGPALPFSFSNPSFNFKSLRGNAVLRWEYLPGSALYLVWTQNGVNDDTEDGSFRLGHSLHRLLRAPFDNILMLKLSYALSR